MCATITIDDYKILFELHCLLLASIRVENSHWPDQPELYDIDYFQRVAEHDLEFYFWILLRNPHFFRSPCVVDAIRISEPELVKILPEKVDESYIKPPLYLHPIYSYKEHLKNIILAFIQHGANDQEVIAIVLDALVPNKVLGQVMWSPRGVFRPSPTAGSLKDIISCVATHRSHLLGSIFTKLSAFAEQLDLFDDLRRDIYEVTGAIVRCPGYRAQDALVDEADQIVAELTRLDELADLLDPDKDGENPDFKRIQQILRDLSNRRVEQLRAIDAICSIINPPRGGGLGSKRRDVLAVLRATLQSGKRQNCTIDTILSAIGLLLLAKHINYEYQNLNLGYWISIVSETARILTTAEDHEPFVACMIAHHNTDIGEEGYRRVIDLLVQALFVHYGANELRAISTFCEDNKEFGDLVVEGCLTLKRIIERRIQDLQCFEWLRVLATTVDKLDQASVKNQFFSLSLDEEQTSFLESLSAIMEQTQMDLEFLKTEAYMLLNRPPMGNLFFTFLANVGLQLSRQFDVVTQLAPLFTYRIAEMIVIEQRKEDPLFDYACGNQSLMGGLLRSALLQQCHNDPACLARVQGFCTANKRFGSITVVDAAESGMFAPVKPLSVIIDERIGQISEHAPAASNPQSLNP